MIDNLFRFLGGKATIFMAAALGVGIIVPPLSATLGPLLPSVVWTVLFFSMIRIDWAEIAAFRHRSLLVVSSILFVLVVSPLLMVGVLEVLGVPGGQGLMTAFVMMAASSPYTAVAAVALILGLDSALALVILVSTTLLMPFVLPVVVVTWLGFDASIDAWALVERLAIMVGIATSLAVIVKRLAGAERLARNSFRIDGMIVIMMVIFGIALVDGVTEKLLAAPAHVFGILLGSFAVNLALVAAGYLFFLPSGRRIALTVGYAAGNGNMAILLAVLPDTIHPDIALYFALGQFPMFMLPMVLKPVFGRILDK
jgi:BASS family bile acid:Na+ symporter